MLLQLRVVDEAALDRLDDTLRLAVDKHPLHREECFVDSLGIVCLDVVVEVLNQHISHTRMFIC